MHLYQNIGMHVPQASVGEAPRALAKSGPGVSRASPRRPRARARAEPPAHQRLPSSPPLASTPSSLTASVLTMALGGLGRGWGGEWGLSGARCVRVGQLAQGVAGTGRVRERRAAGHAQHAAVLVKVGCAHRCWLRVLCRKSPPGSCKGGSEDRAAWASRKGRQGLAVGRGATAARGRKAEGAAHGLHLCSNKRPSALRASARACERVCVRLSVRACMRVSMCSAPP